MLTLASSITVNPERWTHSPSSDSSSVRRGIWQLPPCKPFISVLRCVISKPTSPILRSSTPAHCLPSRFVACLLHPLRISAAAYPLLVKNVVLNCMKPWAAVVGVGRARRKVCGVCVHGCICVCISRFLCLQELPEESSVYVSLNGERGTVPPLDD